jgi:hypothetical protein
MPVPDFEISTDDLAALPWRAVDSSNLSAIALHDEALFVRFDNGGSYRYELNVEGQFPNAAAQLYERLVEADDTEGKSVGSTFHQLVKKRGVPCKRCKVNDQN